MSLAEQHFGKECVSTQIAALKFAGWLVSCVCFRSHAWAWQLARSMGSMCSEAKVLLVLLVHLAESP